jgi:3-hydroxyisobutyrate dehydrogenase-like beta-hydroxyacid dehydrogenase
MNKPRVGFIGLGMMGHGMAKNLVIKGFPTVILGHRNRAPVEDLIAQGAAEARNPADLALRSDIVLLCVTGSPQVEQVVYGTEGLLSAVSQGQIVVDCSTSEPVSTEKIHADFAVKHVPFVDAPLARTPREAEEGRLNVMVGAERDVHAKIEPVLRAFAENIFHVGGPGAGHKFKLINNFFAMGQAALIAEALVAAAKAGLDAEALFKVVSGLDLARKDVRYYTHLTESLGVPSLLGAAVHHAFVQASALGYGSELVGSLVKAQEQIAGTSVRRPSV